MTDLAMAYVVTWGLASFMHFLKAWIEMRPYLANVRKLVPGRTEREYSLAAVVVWTTAMARALVRGIFWPVDAYRWSAK